MKQTSDSFIVWLTSGTIMSYHFISYNGPIYEDQKCSKKQAFTNFKVTKRQTLQLTKEVVTFYALVFFILNVGKDSEPMQNY